MVFIPREASKLVKDVSIRLWIIQTYEDLVTFRQCSRFFRLFSCSKMFCLEDLHQGNDTKILYIASE